MRLHNMFKKTGEKITSIHSRNRRKPEAPEGILKKCNKCGAAILTDEVINGKYICPKCHEGGMRRNEMVVLTSYPAQYEYCCDKCGHVEYQFG